MAVVHAGILFAAEHIGEVSVQRATLLQWLAVLRGPASGVAGGRSADLARREQRTALRGTKASSAAVSFTRSVKERKTANLGHGNGTLLVACELSPDLRTFAIPCDDGQRLTDGLNGPLRLRRHPEVALGIDGGLAREESIDVVGEDLGRNGSILVEA